MNRGTLRKDFIQAYTQPALCSWRNACVAALLRAINLYFSLNRDFCNVSKTFYTFEKMLDSIMIALKVA